MGIFIHENGTSVIPEDALYFRRGMGYGRKDDGTEPPFFRNKSLKIIWFNILENLFFQHFPAIVDGKLLQGITEIYDQLTHSALMKKECKGRFFAQTVANKEIISNFAVPIELVP